MLITSLIIERADGLLWGSLNYEDNLIVDHAKTVDGLKKKIRKVLKDLHNVEEVEFEISYDLTVFFEEFSFLKISKIAEEAGINPSAVRQFASGSRNPNEKQVRLIEQAVHRLGQTMNKVSLAISE